MSTEEDNTPKRRKDDPVEDRIRYTQDEVKDLSQTVDKIESFVDPNSVIRIGTYQFTPAKLMVLGTIVTTVLGGLYGAFEVYKDYMSMKKAITEYVAPDLGEINKKIAVIEKEMVATKETVNQATGYTNSIKNDLKSDIRRVEGVVENIERNSKTSQRETELSLKDMRTDIRQSIKEVELNNKTLEKDMIARMMQLKKETDDKITKALNNPLANRE